MLSSLSEILGQGWCFVAAGLLYHFMALLAVWRRSRVDRALRDTALLTPAEGAGVTLLKPLCGHDEALEQNLESFIQQAWRPMQIVFGAVDPHEPGLQVARKLKQRYPRVDIDVVSEPAADFANPKVQTLEMLARHAKHPWLLISDSNVRARPDDLRCLMSLTTADDVGIERVGVVYQRVVGEGERSVWSALENLKLADYCGAGLTILKEFFHSNTVMGKGMLVSRAALESAGGWGRVGNVAAEDYVLGQILEQAGWRVEMAPVMARAVHSQWSWGGFWNRSVRHASLRFRLAPWTYAGELLFINPVATTFLTMLCLGLQALPAFIVAAVARAATDATLVKMLRGERLAWRYVPLAPVKDLLLAVCCLRGMFVRSIDWRGTMLHLGWGTRLTPAPRGTAKSHDHSAEERRREGLLPNTPVVAERRKREPV